MSSTYSTSLKLQLINNGEQAGTWGSSTNTNWNLIEQAVSGVQTITMANANYTLTNLNGVSDEARNMVLSVVGTNSGIYQIIIPSNQTKFYIVSNQTTGGYAITIGTSGGTLVSIPNGTTAQVYTDGTATYSAQTGSAGDFKVNGNFSVTGNQTDTGNLSVGGTLSVTGVSTFTGAAALNGGGTSTTPASSDASTKIATTAFVSTAVNTATSSLGTMSTQNANNVAITGGTISGLGTPLPVASGGTGARELSAGYALVGNGFASVNAIAPGAAGNVFTSNGTNWVSAAGPGATIRAWLNTDENGNILASYNIASVTNANTGLYNIVFTNAMPSTNGYAISGMGRGDGRGGGYTPGIICEDRGGYFPNGSARTASTVTILRYRTDNGAQENGPFMIQVVA